MCTDTPKLFYENTQNAGMGLLFCAVKQLLADQDISMIANEDLSFDGEDDRNKPPNNVLIHTSHIR